MIVDLLQGTDPEDVIKNAFGCFDEDNVGLVHEDRLRELLTTIGDRFTDDEVGLMSRPWAVTLGVALHWRRHTRLLCIVRTSTPPLLITH